MVFSNDDNNDTTVATATTNNNNNNDSNYHNKNSVRNWANIDGSDGRKNFGLDLR